MSDALNYLLAARPEAMSAYFKFIKQAGEHLDPKTKSLISVISKVSSQTEKGFRQYLTRAMQAGATADEVLDALLMAFPMLGLSKIIWAIEQLQELDLPEFSLQALNGEAQWHCLLKVDDFTGKNTRLSCDGRELFVHRVDDQWRVYDSHCPHQATNITELAVTGNRLTCPKHGWSFDLDSGSCIEKGSRPLKQYETRMEKGQLFVWW